MRLGASAPGRWFDSKPEQVVIEIRGDELFVRGATYTVIERLPYFVLQIFSRRRARVQSGDAVPTIETGSTLTEVMSLRSVLGSLPCRRLNAG